MMMIKSKLFLTRYDSSQIGSHDTNRLVIMFFVKFESSWITLSLFIIIIKGLFNAKYRESKID